ncbi:uncharacterized protein LOC141911833 isoform X2 [Tubulanus polymorphus]|uniref:uncharacterized protein LOC141911833 isoform X2 n=1 Tax=Tubulanus polymorphus TaxID=672921 RepID=UPI003DA46804
MASVVGSGSTAAGQKTGQDGPSNAAGDKRLTELMERLRLKADQMKSWTDTTKALRMAMSDKRHHTECVDKAQLQKHLDQLQKAVKVVNQQTFVEKLNSVARSVGLKFTMAGADCFISSDMFYVEIKIDANGKIQDLNVAHHGDHPVPCAEMMQLLKDVKFDEFTEHLTGLNGIYKIGGDKKQKTAFMALQSLETDLNMLSQLQSSICGVSNYIHKSPLGIVQPRVGGLPMKLIYFVAPYDLLNPVTKSAYSLTVEAITDNNLGHSATVELESATPNRLQTKPLMTVSKGHDGKSLPSFPPLIATNSCSLNAYFVLHLQKPIPMSLGIIRKIQTVTNIEFGDEASCTSMLSLIIDGLSQKFTKKDLLNINPKRGFYVTLPDQQHCYYISDSVEPDDMIGQMITKVPFSHPTSVPQLLVLLRQQLQFNTLIGSCVRPHSKKDDEGSVVFEISPTSLQLITINFEHPLKDAMATVEIDLSDVTNVKCTMEDLQTDEFAAGVGSDDYLCKVIQRCMSIPITMRAVVSKLKTQVKTESITAAAAALLESKELEEAVNGQKYEIVESLLTATQHLPTISASDVVVGDADDADELVSPSLPNAAEQQQQQQADGADGFDYEMFYRDMGPPPKDIVESIGAEKVAKNPMLASLLDQNSPDTETSALLPSLLGGDAAAAAVAASNLQQLKQRKPRKRKVPSDARSPGSASGKSPKRKYSEDDYNMSLDLDSNDAFDLPLVSQQQQHQHQIMPPPAPAAAGGMSSGQQQQQIAASFESILRQDSKNVHGVQQGELAGLLSNIYEPPSSKSQQQTDSAIVKKPTLAKDDLANPVIGDDFIQRGFPSTSSLDELLGSLPEASAISATDTEVFLKEAIKSQDFLSTYGTGVSNTGSGSATAATGGNVSELQQRLTKSEAPEMESSSQSLGFSQPSTGQSSSTTDVGASSKSLTDALMTFESIVDSFGGGERSAVVATATPGVGAAAKAFGRSEKSEQKSSERREKGSSSGGGGGERRDKPPRDKDKKDRDYSKDDRKKSSSSSTSKFAAKSSSSSSKSDDSGTSSSGRSSEYPSKQAKELSKSEKLEQILEYGSDKSSSEKSSSQMFTSTSTGNASIVISTKSGSGGGGGSSASGGGGARIGTSTADGKDPGSGGSSLKMSVKKDKIKKKDSSTYSSSSSSKDPDDNGKRKKDSSSKKDRSYKKRRTGSGADGLKSSPAKSSSSSSSYSVKSDHKSVTTIKITTSGGKLQVQPASSSKTSSSTSSSSPSKSSSSSSGLVSSKTSSSSSKSSSSTTEKTVSPLQMKISSSSSNKTSSISSSSSVSSLSSSQGGGSGGGSSSLSSSSSASQPQQTAGAGSKVTKKYSSSSGVGGTTVTMSKTDSKLMANKTPTIKLKPIVMPSSGGAAASSNTNTAAAVTAPPAVAAASLKPTQTSASSAVTSSSAIVPTTPPIVPSAPITPTVTTPPLGGAAASAAASKSPIKARKSSLSAVIDKLTMAKGGSSGTGAATGSSSSSAPSKSPSAAKTTPEITGSTSIVGEKKDSLMGPPPSKTTAEPPAKILKRESSLEDKVKDTAGISKSTSDPMKDRAKPVTQIAKNSAVAPGPSASSSLSRKSSDSHRGTPSLGPEKVAAKSSIGGATVASSKFEAKRSSDSSPAMASILKTSSTSKPASGADQKGAPSSVSSATGSSGGGSNAGAERKFDSPDRSQMLKIRQNAKSSPVRGDIPEKDLVINKTSAGSHDLVATGCATAAAATTPASPEEKSAASPDCFKPMMLIDDKEIRSPDDVDSMRNERAPIIIPTVKIIDETSTAPRLIPTSPIAAPLPSAAASTTAAAAGAPPVETGAFRVPTPVDQIAEQPYANKKDAIIDLSIASSASEKQVSPRNISSPEDDDGLVIDCPMTPRSAAGAAVTGSAVGDVSKSPALATSIIPTTPAAAVEISAPNPESPAERANASEPARKPGTSGPGTAGAVVAVAVPASPKLLQPVTSPISNPSPCEIDDDLMNEALLGNN